MIPPEVSRTRRLGNGTPSHWASGCFTLPRGEVRHLLGFDHGGALGGSPRLYPRHDETYTLPMSTDVRGPIFAVQEYRNARRPT
jgi:hypothetical protein